MYSRHILASATIANHFSIHLAEAFLLDWVRPRFNAPHRQLRVASYAHNTSTFEPNQINATNTYVFKAVLVSRFSWSGLPQASRNHEDKDTCRAEKANSKCIRLWNICHRRKRLHKGHAWRKRVQVFLKLG